REVITKSSPSVAAPASVGSPAPRSRAYNSPLSLQGSLEMRGGRMWVTLRNADPERIFSGVAHISLSDDQKQQDVTPINVTLLPDKETMFPLDEATLTNGAWILMVYDLNGAARLIRGASLAPPNAPARAPGATNSTSPSDPNLAPEVPPSYVTTVCTAPLAAAASLAADTEHPVAIRCGLPPREHASPHPQEYARPCGLRPPHYARRHRRRFANPDASGRKLSGASRCGSASNRSQCSK